MFTEQRVATPTVSTRNWQAYRELICACVAEGEGGSMKQLNC